MREDHNVAGRIHRMSRGNDVEELARAAEYCGEGRARKVPESVRRSPAREYYSFATDPELLALREDGLQYAVDAYQNR